MDLKKEIQKPEKTSNEKANDTELVSGDDLDSSSDDSTELNVDL